jgi:hypothetical protein
MENINIIDFGFFNNPEKSFNYSILIVLNRPIIKEQFLDIRKKVDYVVVADGAANRMYDNLGTDT